MQLHDPDCGPPGDVQQPAPVAHDDEQEDWGAAWALLWVMIAGKILIIVALLVMLANMKMVLFIAAYNWSWILLILVLGGGPAAFWVRLRRVRRKRAELLRQEWDVD
jgi:hypothetical protein